MSNSSLNVGAGALHGQDGKQRPLTREFGTPVERQHASDQVFREIASAILNRALAPGGSLPPERELSERFGVSRIVVREAIHRLKEYELVRVRQGSPTIVLDPEGATDFRLLGLEIELLEPSASGVDGFAERQVYAGAALLDLAEQRMTEPEMDALERLTEDFLATVPTVDEGMQYEKTYWLAVARGSRNRILLREALWYFNLLDREPQLRIERDSTAMARLYKAMMQPLRARSGTAAMYLSALRSLAQ